MTSKGNRQVKRVVFLLSNIDSVPPEITNSQDRLFAKLTMFKAILFVMC